MRCTLTNNSAAIWAVRDVYGTVLTLAPGETRQRVQLPDANAHGLMRIKDCLFHVVPDTSPLADADAPFQNRRTPRQLLVAIEDGETFGAGKHGLEMLREAVRASLADDWPFGEDKPSRRELIDAVRKAAKVEPAEAA